MFHRSGKLGFVLGLGACAVMPAAASATVIYDSGGFESLPSGSINGDDGWEAFFPGSNGVDVSNNRPITGSNSLRQESSGTPGSSRRSFSFTPDASNPTLLTVFSRMGNTASNDSGFATVGITGASDSFSLVRASRDGSNDKIVGFINDAVGTESNGGEVLNIGVGVSDAYELEASILYNPGVNDDQVRVRFRDIGATAWTDVLTGADSEGFVALGFDAPTTGLSIGARSNLGGGFQSSVRIDDIVLTSTVLDSTVIPEPASLSLAGLGSLLVLARRRRR